MRKHPILILIGILLVVWIAWDPVMRGIGRRSMTLNPVNGEWVGQLDIQDGYDPATMGNTPGPHRKAAIHFNLSVENLFLMTYTGPGEFYIAGETRPRPMHMGAMHVGEDGVTAHLVSDPDLTDTLNGTYRSKPQSRVLGTKGKLIFKAHLHPGSVAEYNALVKSFQGASAPPPKIKAAANCVRGRVAHSLPTTSGAPFTRSFIAGEWAIARKCDPLPPGQPLR